MRKSVILAIVLVLVLLAVPLAVIATPPTQAHVHFGDENAGSPFDPGEGHDQSFHASDKMVPRTVVISQGGSVTFSITPPHQVAIYGPGTTPNDINLDPIYLDDLAVPFPPFIIPDILINYPVGRVALSPEPNFFGHTDWTPPPAPYRRYRA
jgi:hypothetical protein